MKIKKLNASLSLLTLALLYTARDPVCDLRFCPARFKSHRLQKAEYQNGFLARQRGHAFSVALDPYFILSSAAKQRGRSRIYLCRSSTNHLLRRVVLPYLHVLRQLAHHARAAHEY